MKKKKSQKRTKASSTYNYTDSKYLDFESKEKIEGRGRWDSSRKGNREKRRSLFAHHKSLLLSLWKSEGRGTLGE